MPFSETWFLLEQKGFLAQGCLYSTSKCEQPIHSRRNSTGSAISAIALT